MAILSKAFGDEFDHQTVDAQTQEAIGALKKAYPQLFEAINAGKISGAQGDLAAAKATTGGFNDLALSELERTQPAVSRIQGALDAGQAANDVRNLETYGVPAGQALRATDAAASPEFYSTLATLGDKYGTLLDEASPNTTPGERAEMERGIARSNPGMADNSAVNLAEKASEFGSAKTAKVARFADIVNSVASSLPQLKTGLNPASLALGRDSRASTTGAAVTPVVKPTGEATKLGAGLFGQLSGTQSDINKMRAGAFKTWGDALLQDTESFKNIASGASSIAGMSDRNIKADIKPVDEAAVLEKVMSLPISTWYYKGDQFATPHIGPMAQDFMAAFRVGDSDKKIDFVDGNGVLLAAVKALAKRVLELESKLNA